MPRTLKYELTDAFPHAPKSIIVARLAAHSAAAAGGCRLWVGTRHSGKYPGGGMMRLMRPHGGTHTLPATKLAWWAAHGHYPREPQLLTHSCQDALCIAVEHLRLKDRRDQKKLTDAQVVEARALYWRPFMRLTPCQRAMKAPTPVQLAAWRLGMSPVTVQRIVDGHNTVPAKWQGYAKTTADVLRAVADCQREHEARLADKGMMWTMRALCLRYGISESCMHRLLHGEGYSHVPMPSEARLKLQQRAQQQLAEERLDVARRQHILATAAQQTPPPMPHRLDLIRPNR